VRIAAVRVGPFPEARSDSAAADTGAAARRDTTPGEPVPSQSLFVRTAAPLAAETQYTVAVAGVRNLSGLVGGGEAQLKTPKAAPPTAPAATVAPADSGRGRAPAPRPPAAPPPPSAPRPVTSPAPVALTRGTARRPNRPVLISF